MTAEAKQAAKVVPWKGRPRVADPRTQSLRIRLTPTEAAGIAALAAQASLTVGAFARAAILGSPGPNARRVPSLDRTALAQALGLLSRYGNNLNQLAHAANAAGALPTVAELDRLRAEVTELRRMLRQALGGGGGDDPLR